MSPVATVSWESVLDNLARHVERAGRLLATADAGADLAALDDWEPPAHLGPLPLHLLDRAQLLLDRQQAVIAQIPSALVATRQQLLVGRRIGDATTRPTAAVYLDVTA